MSNTYKIAVLAGDGIGPEVMAVGLDVLHTAAKRHGFTIDAKEYAVGGAAIVWLTSLGFAARLDRAPMSAAARAGRIAAVTLAIVALVFLAVQATGLTDIVIETFRSGPERG